MGRHTRLALSLLAIVGMLTSFAATCAASMDQSEHAQMACCKAGHHTCGTPAKPADCCKTQGSHEQQVTIAKADPLQHPIWTPVVWLTPLWLPSSFVPASVPQVYADTSPPLRPDRPAYITFSVLLI